MSCRPYVDEMARWPRISCSRQMVDCRQSLGIRLRLPLLLDRRFVLNVPVVSFYDKFGLVRVTC